MNSAPEALTDPSSAAEISDQGERVSHLLKDHVYYGHLSIYWFAREYCRGADVLDAGCGAGYGSAYLLEHGARSVRGVDASPKAIEFCKHHFGRESLSFSATSLEQLSFPDNSFDVIYTSNVLEHVADVHAFIDRARKVLRPDGTMIVAVPPIINDECDFMNVLNPYHLNIWTPTQWAYSLGHYFEEVSPFIHGIEKIPGEWKPEHLQLPCPLREDNFPIVAGTVEQMYQGTLTAIYVVRRARPDSALASESVRRRLIDGSYSRPPGVIPDEARQRLRRFFEPAAVAEVSHAVEPAVEAGVSHEAHPPYRPLHVRLAKRLGRSLKQLFS
jgi:SAM-dependent methyltransferase